MSEPQVVTYREKIVRNSSGGAVYGLGVIGALVYYFQHADTAWLFIEGIFKAIFWPAFLIYKVLSVWH